MPPRAVIAFVDLTKQAYGPGMIHRALQRDIVVRMGAHESTDARRPLWSQAATSVSIVEHGRSSGEK